MGEGRIFAGSQSLSAPSNRDSDPCAAALLPIFGEAEDGILPKAVIPST
jgi:hypothetical protein